MLKEAELRRPHTINDAVFRYGAFLTSLITFVTIAFAVFAAN